MFPSLISLNGSNCKLPIYSTCMGKGYSQTCISLTSITSKTRAHTPSPFFWMGGGGGIKPPKTPQYAPGYDYKLSVKRNLPLLQSDIPCNPLHQIDSYLDTD